MMFLGHENIKSFDTQTLQSLGKTSMNYGRMRSFIKKHKEGRLNSLVYVGRMHHNIMPELIGWTYLYETEEYTELGVYVKRTYRRRGIGSILATESKKFLSLMPKVNQTLRCSPWDYIGTSFFERNGVEKRTYEF